MGLMISAVECSGRIDSQDASQREETAHAGHDIDRQDCEHPPPGTRIKGHGGRHRCPRGQSEERPCHNRHRHEHSYLKQETPVEVPVRGTQRFERRDLARLVKSSDVEEHTNHERPDKERHRLYAVNRQDHHVHTVGGEGSVRGSGHLEVTVQSPGQVGDDSTIFQKYSGDCSGSICLLPRSCSGRGDSFWKTKASACREPLAPVMPVTSPSAIADISMVSDTTSAIARTMRPKRTLLCVSSLSGSIYARRHGWTRPATLSVF